MKILGSPLIRPDKFHRDQLAHLWVKDTTKVTNNIVIENLDFRSKLDRGIRRLKARDLLPYLSPSTLAISKWMGHMDQVWATNTLIWTEIHGAEEFLFLKRNGVFNSISHFIETSSSISSYIKRFSAENAGVKQMYAELNSLSGFLTNDILETDWKAELSALAHGGNSHGLIGSDWKADFLKSNSKIKLPSAHDTKPDYISFYDYIDSGEWLTAGSSSIGRVDWEADKTKGHFKARKNMLHYVYTSQELFDMVMDWDAISRNKAFVKDEVGKRRLAVSSNIEGYLAESYFLRLYGHPYKNWKYVTLDESQGQAHNRTAKICNLLKGGAWSLPFDFKSFDHQPTAWEIQAMVDSNLSEVSVPDGAAHEWAKIAGKIRHSYRHSEISMTIDQKHYKEKVTGGLPSGVRMTSLIGNQWNAVITNIVLSYAAEITGHEPADAGARGDDIYIVDYSPIYLAIVRECYKAVNAIGMDAKFGICDGVCEFLRNEISKTGQRGWANRSIPSITQRKPWNPSPWGVSTQVTTTRENIATLERRLLLSTNFLHHANKVKWSKYFKQSYKWLELPTREGGLGVYPDSGWRPGCKISLAIAKSVKFTNLIPTSPKWVKLNDEQANEFTQIKMNKLLATDDIVDVSKYTNQGVLNRVRRIKTIWTRIDVERLWLPGMITPQALSTSRWKTATHRVDERWENFTFMEVMQDAQNVAKILDISMSDLLKTKFPKTWEKVKGLEASGWHRTDAINIVNGSWPSSTIFRISPLVNIFIQNAISKQMQYVKGRLAIARRTYAYTWSGEQQMIEEGILRTYGY